MTVKDNGYGFGGFIPSTYSGRQAYYTEASDEFWMHEAFLASMLEVGKAAPNPTVGCAVVKNGKLLARGATEHFGGRHGERVALSQVSDEDLVGSTVYVTLEPCSHHGKQPPCAELLVEKKISRCVIALKDPFHKVDGKGISLLKENGIEVTEGVLEQEALAWHLPFLFQNHFKRPLLFGKWAQTLDGHLADDAGHSKWITGKEARAYTHFLRQKFDAIMVGASTVIADLPSLDVRDCQPVINRSPIKVILDPKGMLLSVDSKTQETLKIKTFAKGKVIYCGPDSSGSWLDDSTHSILLESYLDTGSLELISREYKQVSGKDLQSILVEGGASVLNSLIKADLLDAYSIFQRPSLLGGQAHRIGDGLQMQGRAKLDQKLDLNLLNCFMLGQDIVLECMSEKIRNAFQFRHDC